MLDPNTEARLRYEIECAEANLRYEQAKDRGEQICLDIEHKLKSLIVMSTHLSNAIDEVKSYDKALNYVLDGMTNDDLACPDTEDHFHWLKEKIAERYAETNA